ncbi:hypothetical protein G7046_g1644 [Stylonectria norvegica]|nr:hypothetical protein G7046_g1644 [Stylonectria norvegica]
MMRMKSQLEINEHGMPAFLKIHNSDIVTYGIASELGAEISIGCKEIGAGSHNMPEGPLEPQIAVRRRSKDEGGKIDRRGICQLAVINKSAASDKTGLFRGLAHVTGRNCSLVVPKPCGSGTPTWPQGTAVVRGSWLRPDRLASAGLCWQGLKASKDSRIPASPSGPLATGNEAAGSGAWRVWRVWGGFEAAVELGGRGAGRRGMDPWIPWMTTAPVCSRADHQYARTSNGDPWICLYRSDPVPLPPGVEEEEDACVENQQESGPAMDNAHRNLMERTTTRRRGEWFCLIRSQKNWTFCTDRDSMAFPVVQPRVVCSSANAMEINNHPWMPSSFQQLLSGL